MNNPKQVKHITTRNLNDESIIIDLHEKRMFHQLNSVGSFIWKKCDGTRSTEQIKKELIEEFAIDAQTAQNDINDFILELENKSLLTSS